MKSTNNNRPTDGTNPTNNYSQLERENKLVLSYLTVRKIIGILGLLFPLILVLGSLIFGSCRAIQDSISNYYHTNMRDVFVGYVCTLSIFLFSYKGYDLTDRIVSALAGIFGLIVALFPTKLQLQPNNAPLPCNIWCNVVRPDWVSTVHLISAALFILCLCYFSLFLFTKSGLMQTQQKLVRDKIYLICGSIMFSCICFLIFLFILPQDVFNLIAFLKPVFWLETVAFLAFGFSWLIKGEYLLKDKI
jgi:hypothetical protein